MRERKPVTPEVAVRLGKPLGDVSGPWVRMPAAHDSWHVDTSGIPTFDPA